ncbi:MAG: type VI secretion system contractile sheath large subunit [Myxococcales bacterium]|jgi:type VI secretion system protein ImpC
MAAQTLDLRTFLSTVSLNPDVTTLTPMISSNFEQVTEEVTAEDRFASSLAAVVYNMKPEDARFDKQSIQDLVATIDELVEDQLNEIIHQPAFQRMEATWRGIEDLVGHTNFHANVDLCLLDVSKDELFDDLELNVADIAGSELFKKVYLAEYDKFGGEPYGAMIGLYDFANTPADITWLKAIGKIASAAHAPFVGSVSPKFFGYDTMEEVNQLRDIAGLFATPRYSKWNELRDSEEAAYIGLVLPQYMARPPYNEVVYPADGIHFNEHVDGDDATKYLWGSSALLFARNVVRSFEGSGWCQYLRGVKGGGLITGLATHTFNLRGEDELRSGVEVSMPDYREFELANCGFIPLIDKKGTADAVFFSAQSIKKSHKFKDAKDSENSQLVTNLSYTFSVTRIAHYLKCIMRDNIGSSADQEYIRAQIDRWISGYVTAIQNPDDLTLRYYPFKAYSLAIEPVAGKIGWFHCTLAVLPHIQFEGLDVDLRVDARLG